MRAIESMVPPPLKKKVKTPKTITVLGRKVVRLGGPGSVYAEYLEPGTSVTIRTGVQVTLRGGDGDWTADLVFALSRPLGNSTCATAYGHGDHWRTAVEMAEERMLDLFRGLGARLDYEVE